MKFCLIKPLADAFKKGLHSGAIDPKKLAELSSEKRRAYLEDFVGKDNAHEVNTLFEEKLLVKDFQKGMINWAKEVAGLKPEVRRGMIARIEKLDERILEPATQDAFLEDLAAKKLGAEVTFEEAKQLSELSKNLSDAKAKPTASDGTNMDLGFARVEIEDFMSDLKRREEKLTLKDFKSSPLVHATEAATKIGGIAKSLKATLDLSAIGRQGFKTMFTHPKLWAENTGKTFLDVFKTLSKKTSDNSVMKALRAEIYSRPESIDGTLDRMKVDIGTGEEAFPESLPEKLPFIGRAFKASEIAYNGFLTRLRADLARDYIKVAKKNGVDLMDKKRAQNIGAMINELTGRSHRGLGKAGDIVNATMFSPKNLQANIDFVTRSFEPGTDPFVRKQSIINLLRVAGGTAGILALASALAPDSVEKDPRSANFGKIKIGNTRYDVTGGMGSLLTLAARLGTNSSKSSVTNEVTDYGNGFGKKTAWDALLDFMSNKLAPTAAVTRDILKRQTSNGDPITVGGEASNLLMPLPISNAISLLQDKSTSKQQAFISMFVDALGFASNTYGDQTSIGQKFVEDSQMQKTLHELSNAVNKPISFTDWETSKSADIQEFKSKMNSRDWEDAKARFDFQIQTRVQEALDNPKFKNWSNEDKVRYINQIDTEAKNKVFSQFNFKHSKPKEPPKQKLKL